MQFSYKSEDGDLELIELISLKDEDTVASGTPRVGTNCQFKIKDLKSISTEQETKSNYAPSTYLARCASDSVTINTIVGVSSTSEFDRLVDVGLTRLHTGETASFSLNSYRSGISYSFKLELVEINESIELYDISSEKIEELCCNLKDEGVQLFSQGFIVDAFYKFSGATKLSCLPHPRTRKSVAVKFISTLLSNMASCHVKLGNWDYAIDLCNLVLQKDPNNLKNLYRRGLSYIEIQEYEKAEVDLLKSKELDPDNQAVKKKLAVLDERTKALNAKYAQAMKKFFS